MPTPAEHLIHARQVGRLVFGGVLLAGVAWLVAVLVVGSFEPPADLRVPVPAEIATARKLPRAVAVLPRRGT